MATWAFASFSCTWNFPYFIWRTRAENSIMSMKNSSKKGTGFIDFALRATLRMTLCGKQGVAGRRLSPAVGVRGRPGGPYRCAPGWQYTGAGARGILPPQKSKALDCQNLTFTVCIFIRARFHADDIPYSARDFGPFRSWRRGRRMRYHATIEDRAVPDYRGNCGVARVLRRVKKELSSPFWQKCRQKGLYYTTFSATFCQYSSISQKNNLYSKHRDNPLRNDFLAVRSALCDDFISGWPKDPGPSLARKFLAFLYDITCFFNHFILFLV